MSPGQRPLIRQGLRQQDHAGARAPHGHALTGAALQRLTQLVEVQQLGHRGAFAAGDDEGVDGIEIAGESHLDRVRAKAAQRELMLKEVALQ